MTALRYITAKDGSQKRVVKGASRSLFKENKLVPSQFTGNKFRVSQRSMAFFDILLIHNQISVL